MSLVNSDTLLPDTVPYLPGAPEALIKRTIARACRDFAVITGSWRAEIKIDSVVDQIEYPISLTTVGDDLRPSSVIKLTDDDDQEVSEDYFGFKATTETLTIDERLVPDENTTDAWTALVEIEPKPKCRQFPDWFFELYLEAITGKTLELLAQMENRPWFSRVLFETGRREWRRGVQRAMIDTNGDFEISG